MLFLMPTAVTALSDWLADARSSLLPAADGRLPAAPGLPSAGHVLLLIVLVVLLLPLVLNISAWVLWILVSIVVGIGRAFYCGFVLAHIMVDVWCLSAMKSVYTVYRYIRCVFIKSESSTRHRLLHARDLDEYLKLAARIDHDEGLDKWREDESDLPQADLLKATIAKLDESLKAHDVQKLQFTLLNGLIKRNHLGIDERNLHLHALSGTKLLVEEYASKIVECINYLCDCEELSREEKVSFFKKARRALGQTALMLSGGGAIAMYHAGVIRALIKTGMYKYIRVISGTSGGSIIAGMLAMHTEKDLMEKVLVNEVSTDYKGTGEMKRDNIRWFPPLLDQIKHFAQNGVLVDNLEFQRTCAFYYGDVTFQEAFEKTRKHVCISVSASTLGVKNPGGPRRLLLNHITSPHVLIRSAVAASCSLPGIMRPNYLLVKDERGQVVPFVQDGVQYVDGSLQADLPFRRISTLFAASNFIVSQVNFHIVPLLHKPHSPSESSLYWRVFRFLDMDIRHRVTSLAELGLLPRVFGQDVSGVFTQRYHGHITITPRFRTGDMIGLKAVQNPTVVDMAHYIINGERSVWQMLGHIKHNTCVERTLADCLSKLRRQTYLASIAGNGNGNGTAARAPANSVGGGGSSTGASTPRSLPPLAPSSASSSRSGTPRRYHQEEAAFPPEVLTTLLRRADSGRFDDDGDMLEGGTPRAGAGGQQQFPSPSASAAQLQALQREREQEAKRVRELEEENERLKAALAELLSKTDRGVWHHQESMLTEGDLLSFIQSRSDSVPSNSNPPSRSPSLRSRSPMAGTASGSSPPVLKGASFVADDDGKRERERGNLDAHGGSPERSPS